MTKDRRPRAAERNPETVALVLLVTVTAAWGSTFVAVKDTVAHGPVLGFLAWRFILAGGALALARPGAVLQLSRRDLSRGALLGLLLAGGYVAQTFGLRYTSAAVSGFLTGLQVVFTPLLGWAILAQRPRPRMWAATALATAGLGVISLRGFSVGPGELLTVAGAGLFAGQIVGVGRWSSPQRAYGLATVQLLTVAVSCSLAGLPQGPPLPAGGGAWATVVATALVATAFAFAVQSWAQPHLPTGRAAIVFTLEPVFAALAAWGAGEPVGLPVLAGGGLVLVAMLTAEAPGPVLSYLCSALRARARWPARRWRPGATAPVRASVAEHDLAELRA
jgi:drug/metabolite transporter (DMT)-like permease